MVAEEVRNLAVRSAQAVKETTGMVEETTKNIEQGTAAARKTAEQLDNIVSGSSKVAEFLGEIALASKEESASAAEELASQAKELSGMVDRFVLNEMVTLLEPEESIENPVNNGQIRQSGNGKHHGMFTLAGSLASAADEIRLD